MKERILRALEREGLALIAINAALYTVDVLIPAPAIAQAGDWYPQGIGLAVAAGLHVLGWLLAITVIAAITRSFSRT